MHNIHIWIYMCIYIYTYLHTHMTLTYSFAFKSLCIVVGKVSAAHTDHTGRTVAQAVPSHCPHQTQYRSSSGGCEGPLRLCTTHAQPLDVKSCVFCQASFVYLHSYKQSYRSMFEFQTPRIPSRKVICMTSWWLGHCTDIHVWPCHTMRLVEQSRNLSWDVPPYTNGNYGTPITIPIKGC